MIEKINIKQGGVETPSFTSIDEQYEYAHNLAEAIDNASEVNIEAKIRIPFCAPSDKKRIEDKVGHEVIENEEGYIQFEDNEVRKILVASTNPRIDTNGDGKISIAEAEAATSLPSFQNNTKVESFEEFGMFKNLEAIPDYEFHKCSNLSAIKLPKSIKRIGYCAFRMSNITGEIDLPNLEDINQSGIFSGTKITKVINLGKITRTYDAQVGNDPQNEYINGAFGNCTELTEVILPETLVDLGSATFAKCDELRLLNLPVALTRLGHGAFADCPKLIFDEFNLPNLITIEKSPFATTDRPWDYDRPRAKVKRIINLGHITAIEGSQWDTGWSAAYGAFYKQDLMTLAILPETLQSIDGFSFYGCTSLDTMVLKPTVPPSLPYPIQAFDQVPFSDGIYVPDASVAAYKSADGWSTYASKIKGFSEAPSEMREEYGF